MGSTKLGVFSPLRLYSKCYEHPALTHYMFNSEAKGIANTIKIQKHCFFFFTKSIKKYGELDAG